MSTISIVSGGGTGIGRAIARALAADGDEVRILGRRPDVLDATAAALNAQLGAPRVGALPIDLTDPQAVAALPDRLGTGTRVRALVNNAGGIASAPAADDLEALAERWQADFETNVLHGDAPHRGAARSARAPGRPRRHDQLDRGPARRRALVRRRQGGPARPHLRAGLRAGRRRDHGQRRRAGLRRGDRVLRRGDDAGAPRRARRRHAERPAGATRGRWRRPCATSPRPARATSPGRCSRSTAAPSWAAELRPRRGRRPWRARRPASRRARSGPGRRRRRPRAAARARGARCAGRARRG
jgi:NAD(P)-dependent dehydrogenase (short-subunit alcohol dehydrogenase family)